MLIRFLSVMFLTAIFSFPSFAQIAIDSDEFTRCTEKAIPIGDEEEEKRQEPCYIKEAQRYLKEIENVYYNELPKIERFKTLGGNVSAQEFFKRMYNTWKLYVKNYCDILAISENQYDETPLSFGRATCLYSMTKKQYEDIGNIPFTYTSTMHGHD